MIDDIRRYKEDVLYYSDKGIQDKILSCKNELTSLYAHDDREDCIELNKVWAARIWSLLEQLQNKLEPGLDY